VGLKHRLKRLQQQDVTRQPRMDEPEVTIWLPRKDGSEPPGPMPLRLPHSIPVGVLAVVVGQRRPVAALGPGLCPTTPWRLAVRVGPRPSTRGVGYGSHWRMNRQP
jgi:hypothetical protein